MASIGRFVNRQGRHFGAISRLYQPRAAPMPAIQHTAFISTSDKKKDVSMSVEPMQSPDLERLTKHFGNTDKDNEENYTSYGYVPGDRDEDWFIHHTLMFFTITLGFIGGGFILSYMPDLKFHDWCHREAFLELARREREGLPLVDVNLVDPNTIVLPSEEELGETEVVI